MSHLKRDTNHETGIKPLRDFARILPQILVVLSYSTKALRNHIFRLRFTSLVGSPQSLFAESKRLQSALDELERLVVRASKMGRAPGKYSIGSAVLLG
jgi:hypothetical protein